MCTDGNVEKCPGRIFKVIASLSFQTGCVWPILLRDA